MRSSEHEFLEFDPVQRAMALDITAGFCHTKLIEDGVHEGAECERHESRNGKVAPRAVWAKVISSSVMSSVHMCPEVKVDSTMQLARAGKIAPFPGTLHNPLRRRPFLRCRLGRYVGVLPCRCRNYRRQRLIGVSSCAASLRSVPPEFFHALGHFAAMIAFGPLGPSS